MKTFYELTDKEILGLTDEEIERYCDIELMRAGVIKPIAPIRPKDPEPMDIRKEQYYEVSLNYRSIVFKTLEQAEVFTKLEPLSTDRVYEFEREVSVISYSRDLSIKTIEVANSDDVNKYKVKAGLYKKEKEEYDKLFKKYNEECSAFQEITEGVFDKRREVENKNRQIDKIIETFEGYLVLADNDKKIAFNFLKKAYSWDDVIEAFQWNDKLDFLMENAQITDNADE